ncbi:MAG: hypothetical protein AABX71_00680, partial [Nanoarchaeota archaeon]
SGDTILSESENVAIGNSASMTKAIEIPKGIEPGEYVFAATSAYQNTLGTSSHLFKVALQTEQTGLGYIIIVIAVILVIVIYLVIYSVRKRDELFLELQRQHQSEMRLQFKLIEEVRRGELKELRGKVRVKRKKEFKRIEKEEKKKLKRKYAERKEELKKLKRRGLRDEMKRKIKGWQKEGYDVSYLKSRLNKPAQRTIEKRIEEWKKRGYDVGVLGK